MLEENMMQDAPEEKRRYEAPVVVPLGELAKGSGLCATGSGDADDCMTGNGADWCGTGNAAIGIESCAGGIGVIE